MKLMRRNLIYAPLAVVFLFVLLAEIVIETQLASLLKENKQREQVKALNILYDHLHHVPIQPDTFQSESYHFAELSGYRITLINQDGVVISDSNVSDERMAKLDNHGNRPEVIQSQKEGLGIAWRYSATLDQAMLYTAKSLNWQGEKYTLRISQPLGKFNTTLKELSYILYGIGGLALICTITFGLLVTRYVNELMQKEQRLLEHRVLERTQDISELNRIGTLLSACNHFQELKNVIQRSCSHLLPGTSGAISIFHASKNKLEIITSWGELQIEHSHYMPDDCWSLRKGTSYLCEVETGGIHCPHTEATHIHGDSLCIPLIAQGDTIGAIHFYSSETGYLQENLILAQSIAESLSLAIANLQLRDKLHRQAIRDPLTGLFNRRYLMENVEKEFTRCKRHEKPLAVLMLDVDHFKKYNDDLGHDAGDTALIHLGRTLEEMVRNEDIVCRYGGEEFAIILVDSDQHYSMEVANRICQRIREMEIIQTGRELPRITVSIGLAIYPIHAHSSESLFKQADTALYQAKAEGRNRALMANTEVDGSN